MLPDPFYNIFFELFSFCKFNGKRGNTQKTNPEKESEQPQSQETIAKQTPKKRIKRSSKQQNKTDFEPISSETKFNDVAGM
ncbi:hypothetical protein HGD80_00125 [Paulownia witches'-broom phytoplasma]|uniref:Uncharacterized protein n=1 Tax=Paulownia witches'-broom phytoplasma TaxID=39647 RepID=A0ABX8TPS8_9MOLU|nr:hypothetical protein [Paulownia witches'-broom phytoplasma]QYC31043.1 hypothetical protein HGD80_00125 [Paulownia witches'-broom phytoplasma]GLH60765.1 hypothetical protein PAWBP_5030 [Paulownia witches'-broom phytoplasma]